MSALVKAVWVHQFNKLTPADREFLMIPNLLHQYVPEVYVKALDSTQYMNSFDTNLLACDRHKGSAYWSWNSRDWTPWTNPTGASPSVAQREAALAMQLLCKRVILDLEPYEHHWQGGFQEMVVFLDRLSRPVDICLDHRRLPGFPTFSWWAHVSRILPQVYWTTFERPWREVLEEALGALQQLDIGAGDTLEIEWVIPGNAEPNDFADALEWIKAREEHASVWVWQSITFENWDTIAASNASN